MKSSDANASKCHLKFSSLMMIFIKLVYLNSVISLIGNYHCHLSEITELKHTSLIKIIIKEENFKWHLEAFASELFIYAIWTKVYAVDNSNNCLYLIMHLKEAFNNKNSLKTNKKYININQTFK